MAALPMTDEEIVRQYRLAKHKGKELQILADLNGCKPEIIRALLVENGVGLKELPRSKRAAESPAEEVAEPDPVYVPDIVDDDDSAETSIARAFRQERDQMTGAVEEYIAFHRREINRLQNELDAFIAALRDVIGDR